MYTLNSCRRQNCSSMKKGVVFQFYRLSKLSLLRSPQATFQPPIFLLSLFLKRNRLSFNQLFAQKWANLYPVPQVLWDRLPRSAARVNKFFQQFSSRSHKDCSSVIFPSRSDDIHEALRFPACLRTHTLCAKIIVAARPRPDTPKQAHSIFFIDIASVA